MITSLGFDKEYQLLITLINAAKASEMDIKPKKRPVPTMTTKRRFYGTTYLLDQIGKKTGVTEEFKLCFLWDYKRSFPSHTS